MRHDIEVMHGVNLNMLGSRDPHHYSGLDFTQLEIQIEVFARELGLAVRFFQTNYEGEFVEELHRVSEVVDGVILNPGAWTHYSWAIHDALEIVDIPAVEVHLSDVYSRDEWRHTSVIKDLCLTSIVGKGVDGYRLALQRLKEELG